MIFKKNFLFFKSLRVLYQNENLAELADKNKYDYITIISYSDLGLENNGFSLVHKKIANVYLDKDIDDVLSRFSRTTRQEINKTFKIPQLEFKTDDKDIRSTYRLYKDFERAQGRKPWKIESFNNNILFNAYYRGRLIASVPCYDVFPYLQVRAIFSQRLKGSIDHELYKVIGSATRRLIYEICRYGRGRDYKFVGLGAVNYSTPQKANVSNFKMFFGSRVEDEYTYTYKSKRFVFMINIKNIFKRFCKIRN